MAETSLIAPADNQPIMPAGCAHVGPFRHNTISVAPDGNGNFVIVDEIRCASLTGPPDSTGKPTECGYKMQFPGGRVQQTRMFAAQMARFEPVPVTLSRRKAGRAAKSPPQTPTPPPAQPAAPDPSKGLAGTEMLLLTQELEIKDDPSCGCKRLAAQMDAMGVEGCRIQFNGLLFELQKNYEKYGWKEKLHTAKVAIGKGIALQINPVNPLQSLLDISINRAEAKAKAYVPTAETGIAKP